MNNIKSFFYWFLTLVATCVSCNTTIDSPAELYRWIHDEDNGFVKARSINNIVLVAKYLPPEYLALQELRSEDTLDMERFHELKEEYADSKTFLLTIAPRDGFGDVMYYGVQNQKEYEDRFRQLNFHVDDLLALRIGTQRLRPVLHTMENTYELTKEKSIYLVFSSDVAWDNAQKMDLVFDDRLFETGISHFVFNQEELELPPIKL